MTCIKAVENCDSARECRIRLITGTRQFDHITPILRDLHRLPVHLRIKYKIAMLVNKCLRDKLPRIWLSFANQWLSLLDVGI